MLCRRENDGLLQGSNSHTCANLPQKPTERILEFISYPARLLHYIPDKNRVFPKNPVFSLPKLYIFFALYILRTHGQTEPLAADGFCVLPPRCVLSASVIFHLLCNERNQLLFPAYNIFQKINVRLQFRKSDERTEFLVRGEKQNA